MLFLTKRKVLIIEKAAELFAENGFDATSVQNITDACGISKGAFYLSFKSKESLVFSIFEYFTDKLFERMSGINDLQVKPRERFETFFSIQFEEVARYSDFILMQMREQISPMNEDMMGLMQDIRQKTYDMEESLLVDLYGEKISGHLPDLLVLVNGIITGYIEIIVFNKDSLDYKKLASYILERIDSIVDGLSVPFLKSDQLISYNMKGSEVSVTTEEILREIELLKRVITDNDLLVSLDVIEQELSIVGYRKPVISGMMSNFKNNEVTEGLVKKITKFLN